MREVAILGVGMHPFGAYYSGKTNAEMSLVAGLGALDDAGLTFADVDAAYTGHIFAMVMSGMRIMKEFGLTVVPV
jgi:acetyl-CoA acetyltransferase